MIGRDFDADDLPMELDEDSDAGGCFDGMEDSDLDGKYKQPETWNFDEGDDACFWGTDELVLDDTAVYDDGSHHQRLRTYVAFSLRAVEGENWRASLKSNTLTPLSSVTRNVLVRMILAFSITRQIWRESSIKCRAVKAYLSAFRPIPITESLMSFNGTLHVLAQWCPMISTKAGAGAGMAVS